MAHVITIGNEKGGAGKSTLSMHIACGLLQSQRRVGIMDLDIRQRTLDRFFQNRAAFGEAIGVAVSMPQIESLPDNISDFAPDTVFENTLQLLMQSNDYVVIDCPGALTVLSELAHAAANTLVTPMNDSLIDFDMLGRVDSEGEKVLRPSIYAEMVWIARKERQLQGLDPIDWVVVRNRLARQHMHNKRKVSAALEDLSKRIGFRLVPGLSDRVIYKELFTKGLTILDDSSKTGAGFSLSNIAAKQELRDLMTGLNLPNFELGF